MHASLFTTLLLAASVVSPAFASPLSIRGGSNLVGRGDPLDARNPQPKDVVIHQLTDRSEDAVTERDSRDSHDDFQAYRD